MPAPKEVAPALRSIFQKARRISQPPDRRSVLRMDSGVTTWTGYKPARPPRPPRKEASSASDKATGSDALGGCGEPGSLQPFSATSTASSLRGRASSLRGRASSLRGRRHSGRKRGQRMALCLTGEPRNALDFTVDALVHNFVRAIPAPVDLFVVSTPNLGQQ